MSPSHAPAGDDEGFVRAIEAAPDDLAPRLVYADWLDERHDPRAELIRLEHAMDQLPAQSDRYWELKPRRYELRAGCDPNWLRRLGNGTDYRPVFADVPARWRDRWRLLREFVERWHRVPMRTSAAGTTPWPGWSDGSVGRWPRRSASGWHSRTTCWTGRRSTRSCTAPMRAWPAPTARACRS